MSQVLISIVALTLVSSGMGFSPRSCQISSNARQRVALNMEYIPDGISKEQWKKMKDEEAKKIKEKGKYSHLAYY
jgi:hypothetical protein